MEATIVEKVMTEKKKVDNKVYGVYLKSLLTCKVSLNINEIGSNLKQNLEKKLAAKIENKCSAEGFIKPNSVSIVSYSSGTVNSANVDFQVVYECMVCNPVEGMLIECTVKTITKAGIRGEVVDENGTMPVTVFVARDHNYNDHRFQDAKENTKILTKVIGVRYELNDPYVCVISKLADYREPTKRGGENEKLNLLEGENVVFDLDDFDHDEINRNE